MKTNADCTAWLCQFAPYKLVHAGREINLDDVFRVESTPSTPIIVIQVRYINLQMSNDEGAIIAIDPTEELSQVIRGLENMLSTSIVLHYRDDAVWTITTGTQKRISVTFQGGKKRIFKMKTTALINELKQMIFEEVFVPDGMLVSREMEFAENQPVVEGNQVLFIPAGVILIVKVCLPFKHPECVVQPGNARMNDLRRWAMEKTGELCAFRFCGKIIEGNPYLCSFVYENPDSPFQVEPEFVTRDLHVSDVVFKVKLRRTWSKEDLNRILQLNFVVADGWTICEHSWNFTNLESSTDWRPLPLVFNGIGGISLRVCMVDRATHTEVDPLILPLTATVETLVNHMEARMSGNWEFYADGVRIFDEAHELLSSRVLNLSPIEYHYIPQVQARHVIPAGE
jgi:hypothetical protein